MLNDRHPFLDQTFSAFGDQSVIAKPIKRYALID
jgi:hypothetical protein